MTGILIRQGNLYINTHIECQVKIVDTLSQAKNYQKLGVRHGTDSSLMPSEGIWPAITLISDF